MPLLKDVLITTGRLSEDAAKCVESIDPKMILIDGRRLAVGVLRLLDVTFIFRKKDTINLIKQVYKCLQYSLVGIGDSIRNTIYRI